MGRKTKLVLFCSVLVLLVAAVPGRYAEPKQAEKYGGIKDVKILASASSSPVTLHWTIRAKAIDRIPGIRASCMAGSPTRNVDILENNNADISISISGFHKDIVNGTGPFKGKKYSNIAFLTNDTGFRVLIMAVRADSDIYTMDDFKGKHLATRTKRSSTAQIWIRALTAIGMSPDEIARQGGRLSYISTGDVTSGLRDKSVDVDLCTCGHYNAYSGHIELDETVGMRLIPFREGDIKRILASNPDIFFPATLPAGLYKNQTEDYQTFSFSVTTNICRLNLPDDLVYDILTAIYGKKSRREQYESYPPSLVSILENGLQGSVFIPIHPGAARFYKDNGVTETRPDKMIWPKSMDDALNKYGGQWD